MIDLLTIEDVKNIDRSLLTCQDGDWWLKDGVGSMSAAFVGTDGTVHADGLIVNRQMNVRPCLRGELKEVVHGKKFIKVSDNLAICEGIIGTTEFKKDGWYQKGSNDFENSDIKLFIEKWMCKLHREDF